MARPAPDLDVEERLQEAYNAALQAVLQSIDDRSDGIHQCGPAAIRLLSIITRDVASLSAVSRPPLNRIDDLLRLAYNKLHSYPFKDVPLCWRRLYADVSILKAISIRATEPLDLALILVGAPRRRELVEDIFAVLEEAATTTSPSKKRRRMEFPVSEHTVHVECPIRRTSTLANYQSPTIITGAIDHWPARTRWTASYLLRKTLDGRRLVPVEIGRAYTDEGWGQSIMPFHRFLDEYILSAKVAYLAQHDLFAQIPSLRNDICIPDCCYTTDSDSDADPLINAWFGPAGTVSPLHTDPYDNVLCQVVGKKYVRLYGPDETPRLYPRGVEDSGVDMGNTSQVEVEGDHADYPLFDHARYVEGVLNEGECLYIPGSTPRGQSLQYFLQTWFTHGVVVLIGRTQVGWWHYVRSLSVSFSVSFWFH